MKIYAIIAHDKKDSLNGFIFEKIVDHLVTKNADVDILRLYDYTAQIPFFVHNKEKIEQNAFFQDNKKRFMQADRLLIVHPIYWYSVPAILKAWIDLITNFAWKYEKGYYAKALHKIKKAMVVNTSMAPAWYRKYLTSNPATRQLKETFRFFGILEFYFYEIGSVNKLDKQKVEKHVQKILKVADKLF